MEEILIVEKDEILRPLRMNQQKSVTKKCQVINLAIIEAIKAERGKKMPSIL